MHTTEEVQLPGEAGREVFESWVTAPPFEKDITRCSNESAWPGTYKDYAVELAWQAWQARG